MGPQRALLEPILEHLIFIAFFNGFWVPLRFSGGGPVPKVRFSGQLPRPVFLLFWGQNGVPVQAGAHFPEVGNGYPPVRSEFIHFFKDL